MHHLPALCLDVALLMALKALFLHLVIAGGLERWSAKLVWYLLESSCKIGGCLLLFLTDKTLIHMQKLCLYFVQVQLFVTCLHYGDQGLVLIG